MYSGKFPVHYLTLVLTFVASAYSTCCAQEVAYLDLTTVEAHDNLRRPRGNSETPKRYSSIGSTNSCPDPTDNTGVLYTSLLSLDRTNYQVGDRPTFEVTIQNNGSEPIRIPFSPSLGGLQPENPAEKFAYFKLQITLWIAGDHRWSTNMGGSEFLYGADNHANTMLTLKPGEWVRVRARGYLGPSRNLLDLMKANIPVDHAYAKSSLFREETLITSRNAATVASELCINQTVGASVSIQLTVP